MQSDQEWEVEKILERGKFNKMTYYLVKWVGYPQEQATWEPISNLSHCEHAILQFQSSVKKQSRKRKNNKKPLKRGKSLPKQQADLAKMEPLDEGISRQGQLSSQKACKKEGLHTQTEPLCEMLSKPSKKMKLNEQELIPIIEGQMEGKFEILTEKIAKPKSHIQMIPEEHPSKIKGGSDSSLEFVVFEPSPQEKDQNVLPPTEIPPVKIQQKNQVFALLTQPVQQDETSHEQKPDEMLLKQLSPDKAEAGTEKTTSADPVDQIFPSKDAEEKQIQNISESKHESLVEKLKESRQKEGQNQEEVIDKIEILLKMIENNRQVTCQGFHHQIQRKLFRKIFNQKVITPNRIQIIDVRDNPAALEQLAPIIPYKEPDTSIEVKILLKLNFGWMAAGWIQGAMGLISVENLSEKSWKSIEDEFS